MSKLNEALQGEKEYRTAVESATEYIENFDILETITNVGNDEVFTPRKIADMMLDSLPDEVWHNPDYKWLNPATKNGVFEREIAIRLDKGLADIIPDMETRRKHILQKMIFSLGQTKFTSNVARRTVYYCSQANRKCDGVKAPGGHYVNGYAIGNGTWFDDEEGNIKTPCTEHEFVDSRGRTMPDDCSGDDRKKYSCKYCGTNGASKYNDANQREKYAYEFIHIEPSNIEQYLQNRFFKGDKKMKFDVIIGNPPYQLSDGGQKASATPIYQLFAEKAKQLKPRYLSLIIPARWFSGGRGLDSFRDEMLNDPCIRKTIDFTDSEECFPGVDIAGGVCYFVWERDNPGPCEVTTIHRGTKKTVVRQLNEHSIFIRHSEALTIIDKVTKSEKYFYNERVSSQKPFGLRTFVKPTEEGDISLRYNGGTGPFWRRDVSQSIDWIEKWKVIMSYLSYDHAGRADKEGKRKIFSTMEILPPKAVCTETYLVIDVFNTKNEAENLIGYLRTKLVRFLVSQTTSTQHIAKSNFAFVPVQDFSKPWTDKELYVKYGLTDEEIAFIESMIKPME